MLALAVSARNGDRSAWQDLVDHYLPVVWAAAETQGLVADDCADAVRLTWLRLLQDGRGFVDAARLEEWLVATCGDESRRLVAVRRWRTAAPVATFPCVVGRTA